MSCNVLIIPEDFRLDQYILQPLVAAMLKKCGRPQARVRVLTNPLLGGIDQATKPAVLSGIVDQYPLVDLFLLLVDRDGNETRRHLLDTRENELSGVLAPGRAFFAQEAWQEVEVWALASQDLPANWDWTAVRAERDPKERYFDPHTERRGVADGPGRGRRAIGNDIGRQYGRIVQRCPELLALEKRVRGWLRPASG